MTEFQRVRVSIGVIRLTSVEMTYKEVCGKGINVDASDLSQLDQ